MADDEKYTAAQRKSDAALLRAAADKRTMHNFEDIARGIADRLDPPPRVPTYGEILCLAQAVEKWDEVSEKDRLAYEADANVLLAEFKRRTIAQLFKHYGGKTPDSERAVEAFTKPLGWLL